MKKFLVMTMSLVMLMQSAAFANKMGFRDHRDQVAQIKVEDLTLAQLDAALADLQKRNSIVQADLADAEKLRDGTFVVKLRNGLGLASGATVAVGLFLMFGQDATNLQMRGLMATVAGGLGLLATGVVQAAVVVNDKELNQMEETVRSIDEKITRLKQRIAEEKASKK